MANNCLSLVVHGGAGAKKGRDYSREIAHMRALVQSGRMRLLAGEAAPGGELPAGLVEDPGPEGDDGAGGLGDGHELAR